MSRNRNSESPLEAEPLWFKDAIIYELHVKTFHDLNGDGMGDFRGLMEKLDYLQDLGVTALWLLPFYPSPLRDDGYDIADYLDVHANYGTLADAVGSRLRGCCALPAGRAGVVASRRAAGRTGQPLARGARGRP